MISNDDDISSMKFKNSLLGLTEWSYRWIGQVQFDQGFGDKILINESI